MIQGDGVNYESIKTIYAALKQAGISAENLVLGMGGALLQKVDRDTQRFALKCSSAIVNGVEVNVAKSPTEMNANGDITASFKKSKSGRLKLAKINGDFTTVTEAGNESFADELQTVFENGDIVKQLTFEEAKANLNS